MIINKIFREKSGITLIAVVISVLVLLLLAGVTINVTIGENGLFSQSKASMEKVGELSQKIENTLDKTEDYILGEDVSGLPDNSQDVPAGTVVKPDASWYTETPLKIRTTDGAIVSYSVKVSSVNAVSVGNGQTVPVPKGFYYVGGNLDTGVIISDDSADEYDGVTDKTTWAYANGLVIENVNGTPTVTATNGPKLQGNQFVWIPCTTSAYTKTSWGKQNAEWDTTTPKAEVQQIEKYGGFYVGRYEAGLASTINEFTTEQIHSDGSNQIYNLEGVPQSRAGVIPWMFIDWTHSKANAESMYNNNYVSSGLITGTQWDVILNTFKSKAGLSDSDITSSGSWGNYMNNSIAYTGRLARADYNSINSSAWTLKPFGATTTGTTSTYSSNHGDLLTTGASEVTQKYHIFDLAGNLWEWTEEDSHYPTTGQYRVNRGGGYLNSSSDAPACYRGFNIVTLTGLDIGFRTVLYMK